MPAPTPLEKAIDAHNTSDKEYKQQLLQYEVALLTAELAVVGFLLQNADTRALMSGWFFKLILILSMASTFMAIGCMVLAKRALPRLDYENVQVESYKEMYKDFSSAGAERELLKELNIEQNNHLKRSVPYENAIKKLPRLSEVFFVSGLVLAVAFVAICIIRA